MIPAPQGMDLICPMHAELCLRGQFRHVGPTLFKLRPHLDWTQASFLTVFEVTRPRAISAPDHLARTVGQPLHLRFRDAPRTALKAVCVPTPRDNGLFVNLSFGISILDAVRDYDLTNTDFAATDLTMEMLYLVEAKSIAMDASRRLNQRLQDARLEAETQALTDPLIGLRNRRGFDRVLDRMIAGRGRFALMQIDLDYFKLVNDTMGHDAGDHVLRHVSRIMRGETRDRDVVARVGGDEFVLAIDAPVSPDIVDRVAQRLIRKIEQPIPFGDRQCNVSCSIGSVMSDQYAQPTSERLFKDADLALYAAKRAGRAQHRSGLRENDADTAEADRE